MLQTSLNYILNFHTLFLAIQVSVIIHGLVLQTFSYRRPAIENTHFSLWLKKEAKYWFVYPSVGKIQESENPSYFLFYFCLICKSGLMGNYSFYVLDTDYDKYALFCSCKTTRVVFKFHSISCSILQRKERDENITKKVLIVLIRYWSIFITGKIIYIMNWNCNWGFVHKWRHGLRGRGQGFWISPKKVFEIDVQLLINVI